MQKPAKVKFIGNPCDYKLGCGNTNYKYCRDCKKQNCNLNTPYKFEKGKIYNAYFLEYWQGKRNSLHIKGEDGEIDDFIPLSDFVIIEDEDNVLNVKEAIVKCVTHDYEELFGITFGKEYKAIGFDKDGYYLVMDDSFDCYFYSPNCFKIISDPFQILNSQKAKPIYYSYNL